MPSGNIAILTLTVVSAAALSANRFIKQSGTYPAAGGRALGVSRFAAAAAGESLAVDVQGTTVAECGGTVAVDDSLCADALGRAVKLTAGAIPVGIALEAGAVGDPIEILLVPTVAAAAAA